MADISKHAEKRMRKRLGLSKSTVERQFGQALEKGKKQADFTGKLRKYLDRKAIEYHATPYILGQNIYWVKNNRLITVYQVHAEYKKYLPRKEDSNNEKNQ